MNIYWSVFWILVFICFLLYFYTRQVAQLVEDATFRRFQTIYLLVYLLAMGADWLQGPYVYALYQHYGMSSHEINVLFVAGFGSSMIVGTIVGSSADKLGRRNLCRVYALLYCLSCITKHYANFWILLVGRFLGGTATSILFSAFEAWLVCEHNKRGFSKELLSALFSRATLGNSLVAISAGHLAQIAADKHGFVAPFDVAAFVLLCLLIAVSYLWNENYGDAETAFTSSFTSALDAIKKDPNIFLLGIVQSFFEGSMYTFVLKWTPALTPEGSDADHSIPHGLIFACFMVSVMIGSCVFKILTKLLSIESFMRAVMLVSALSLAAPIFLHKGTPCILFSFCLFEVCVGLFWPSLGTMRSTYIPEAVRSTVMNFFRIPLNLIVIVILLQDLDDVVVFTFCVVFLVLAFVAQHLLYKNSLKHVTPTVSNEVTEKVSIPEESEKFLPSKDVSAV